MNNVEKHPQNVPKMGTICHDKINFFKNLQFHWALGISPPTHQPLYDKKMSLN